jgi:hypothetical protein
VAQSIINRQQASPRPRPGPTGERAEATTSSAASAPSADDGCRCYCQGRGGCYRPPPWEEAAWRSGGVRAGRVRGPARQPRAPLPARRLDRLLLHRRYVARAAGRPVCVCVCRLATSCFTLALVVVVARPSSVEMNRANGRYGRAPDAVVCGACMQCTSCSSGWPTTGSRPTSSST